MTVAVSGEDEYLDHETEKAMMMAIVGDNPIEYNENGLRRAAALRKAIRAYGIDQGTIELQALNNDGSGERTLRYVQGRLAELEAQKEGLQQ